jgi:hypothetical protein
MSIKKIITREWFRWFGSINDKFAEIIEGYQYKSYPFKLGLIVQNRIGYKSIDELSVVSLSKILEERDKFNGCFEIGKYITYRYIKIGFQSNWEGSFEKNKCMLTSCLVSETMSHGEIKKSINYMLSMTSVFYDSIMQIENAASSCPDSAYSLPPLPSEGLDSLDLDKISSEGMKQLACGARCAIEQALSVYKSLK